MRLTDFWARMEAALGAGYARSWAHDHVLAGLGGRTVDEAIAAGEDTLVVWRAVHSELALHPSDR
ncbi:MAG: DUF3046 domain-containing protein [Actinomycetales bacterium]|nr:DUF3046 domain-containing protein [Actinomycetales bacterium]